MAAALKASESFSFELPPSALPRDYELKADSIRAKKSASLAKSFRSPHFLTIPPIFTDFLCDCTSFQALSAATSPAAPKVLTGSQDAAASKKSLLF